MSFTFDNINCETMSLYVETYPPRPVPVRKSTSYSVIGRNGDLIVDHNSFENTTQEYEVFVKYTAGVTFQEWVSAVAKWLIGKAGYLELKDSYDPNTYRLARVANAFQFMNSLNKFGKATLQFDCKPQRFPLPTTPTTYRIGQNYTYTVDAGLMPALPKMTITGIGAGDSFTITDPNGNTIVVPTRSSSIATLIIDWETQMIYDEAPGDPPALATATGPWDTIDGGETIITTNDAGNSPTFIVEERRFYL